jgi:nitrite reductase (NO-forming)
MMARRHRLPGPLRGVVGFYVASATCLVVGAGIGAALAGQWVADDSTAQQRLHVAHAQLNLFGWIGLAVLGTLVVLWPAVLRTRMVDVAPRVSRWTLALCVTGLAVLVTGVLTGTRDVAVAGVAGYGVGVVSALVTMARTLPGRPSRSSAAWWLGASCCWLLVGVAVDAQRLATPRDADVTLRPLVPILAAGLIGQALVGALTFLLPVTIGGGPQGNRRMTDLLERVWPVRLVLADVGIALVAVPAPPAVHIVGWAAALTGLGSFLPLLTAALVRRAQTPA